MVQTPFTWRYGGHEVLLFGSFNGWSERIAMVLMGGSETIFQIIIDLPPGCYQYKFLVDGTWRVDQQQICDADEYGTMNNIVLVHGTEFMPPYSNAETFQPSTSGFIKGMPSVGSSSGVPLNESVMQLSNGEMDAFRQVLSMHLLSLTAYELIPNSGKVVGLDVDMGMEEAFHVMYEMGLTVVPLWNEPSGQIVGMLTASDFILILLQLMVDAPVPMSFDVLVDFLAGKSLVTSNYILRTDCAMLLLHRNKASFANVDHEIRTIFSWKAWKLQHQRDIVGTMLPLQQRPLIHVGPDESLGYMASRILQNDISAVPIIHSANGSCPRLLHVTCLAEILRNVCRHFQAHLGYLPLLQQPIGCLPIGTWAIEVRRACGRSLLTLHPNDPFSSALTLLLEAQISSIPIVDDGGSILNVYSRSDIISLAKGNFYTGIQLNQMTVSQALEISKVTGQKGYQTCTRFDSLYRVMELLSEPSVRRVIVVEVSSSRVEGIITLRDIFNLF